MNRHSHMELSSLIVFLSIISILIQYLTYYFLDSSYIILGISSLIVIICTYVLLSHSLTYKSCFLYIALTLFISLLITLLTYFGDFLPITNTLYGILIINWLIPTISCLIRSMFDNSSRIDTFNSFYRNVSTIFVLFYIGFILYASLSKKSFPWAYHMVSSQVNFTPFWTIATQIEDYINKMIPLVDILTYLLVRILTLIPYGFYLVLLLRKSSKLLRFFGLLAFPCLIELIQYFIIPARFDIDDIIYGFIGGVIGALLFYLVNVIYRTIAGRNFLSNDSDYRYSNSSLHF